MLLPTNSNHCYKLYEKNLSAAGELEDGVLTDLSRNRARMTSIKRRDQTLVGRKIEIFKGVTFLNESLNLNLYGEPGSGKTFISKEIAYYLNTRNCFRDGFFYFDIDNTSSIEKIKDMLKDAEAYQAIEEVKLIKSQ